MSSDIFEFNSTLSEMESLLETWDESDDENDESDDENDESDSENDEIDRENDEIFTIQRGIGFLRKLCMSAIEQASYDSMCKRNHRQFWSYWEVESTSDICKLGSRECIIKCIQHAGRNLKKDLDDIQFLDKDERSKVLFTMVAKMEVLSEELVEASTSAFRISWQWKKLGINHLVLQLFGHLTQSLWNIMNCKSNLLLQEEAQMIVDEQKLRIVGVLICFVHRQSVEQKDSEDVLSQFGPTADYVASICYMHLIMEMDRDWQWYISKRMTDLLQHIELGDGKRLLGFVDLLLENLRRMPNSNGQVGLLNREVKMLLKFFANMHEDDFQKKKLSDHLVQIEDATCKLISIFCSLFYVKDITEEIHINLPKFVQEVNVIKEEFRNIYPKSTRRIFSNMDGLVFIDFFLNDLKELLVNNKKPISLVKLEVETIQKNLEWFRSFLKVTMQLNMWKDLILRCINVAYEAESMIDTLVIDDAPSWDNMLWLADVMEEIEHIKIEVAEIYENNSLKIIDPNIIDAKKASCVMSTIPTDSDVLGFSLQNEAVVLSKGVEQQIKNLLLSDTPKLDVISIFGMPGLGKTTLAHRVFNSKDIDRRFPNFRIFCRVSEVYNKRELLLDMLRQLKKIPDKVDEKSDEDLADYLRKSLSGERYLIVVDDVWSTEAWDNLQKAFPKQKNGSRVILTTRDQNVALHAKIESEPLHIPLLTEDESWQLLEQRVFKNESCPDELVKMGKRIAENCHGLPLTIVLIAGVMQKQEKNISVWCYIASRFTSQSKNLLEEHYINTINLSFMHLPVHLKPCFLYFAAFPEDEEIQISKLKRLWMAERFIPLTKETSLENVAEDYLMDLISRSLVIVVQKSFTKGVKSILIHDLIRQFCIAKAEEEIFLQFQQRDNPYYQSSPNSYHSRLSIQSGEPKIRDEMNSLRSLLFSYDQGLSISMGYVSRYLPVLEYSKLLKVLDLEVRIDNKILGAICSLIHLRYLAFEIEGYIGPSIANLGKLQTLWVKNSQFTASVSDRLWEMKCLRHVHFDGHVYIEFGESFRNCADFGNVESFSTSILPAEVEDITRKMPNLRKLKCSLEECNDSDKSSCKKCPKLSDFEHLRKLESLDASGFCPKFLFPCKFNRPLNLKKLTLTYFGIPWSEMSIIANSLPNLEVLKLFRDSFSGETWEMEDEIFPELKFLILEELNLKEWSVSHEAFPKLQRLAFIECGSLEQIPSDFEQSCTLQTIEVDSCQQSLGQSALELKEELAELGINDNLQVFISNVQG